MSGDRYVRVKGRIKSIRPHAILLVVGETVERGDWVPRSLIHGADDRTLDGKFAGEDVTIRIFAWKAEDLGFETVRDEEAALHDLFESRDDC